MNHSEHGRTLSAKTVVITRQRSQSAELERELLHLGADVYFFPTIETVAPPDFTELDAAISRLDEYDWLIFTSTNAVDFFVERLREKGLSSAELDLIRTCAVGDATAHRLSINQIHVDVVPDESNAEGIFAALSEYIGDDELPHTRFLLPRAKQARDFLPDALREKAAKIDVVTAYETVLPKNPETAKLKALLVSQSVDAVTFTSSSTVKNFVQILGANLGLISREVRIVCIGAQTAQTARENGLPVHAVAKTASAKSLAEAVADTFSFS